MDSIETFFEYKSEDLYIFFGGIAEGIVVPPFEFYKAANILDCNRIFVRDLSQAWYQLGLKGKSKNIQETKKILEGYISESGSKNVYFVGNSMGGFAAILFSTLIGGTCIAFSPQTFIDPISRKREKDFRWGKQIKRAYIKSLFKKNYWNLASLLEKTEPINVRIYIHVAEDDKLDLKHAINLDFSPNVFVTRYNTGGHTLVKTLYSQNQLQQILRPE